MAESDGGIIAGMTFACFLLNIVKVKAFAGNYEQIQYISTYFDLFLNLITIQL
jgi:hypothetical protein